MKYEEAKEIIESAYFYLARGNGKLLFFTALKKAIEALEKQIPMEHHHTRIVKLKIDVRESVCPCCLGVIVTSEKEYPKHCTWCGQRIDWSEGADIYDPV